MEEHVTSFCGDGDGGGLLGEIEQALGMGLTAGIALKTNTQT